LKITDGSTAKSQAAREPPKNSKLLERFCDQEQSAGIVD
jgi:hypothetical protein